MNSLADEPIGARATSARTLRGHLFRKYAAMFVGVVCLALVAGGVFDVWFSYQEQKDLLVRIQRGQAESAAAKITQFIKEIEGQMAWVTPLPWNTSTFEEWRLDAVRLLRQAPAITELAQLDATGRERYRVSRQAMDAIESHIDYSGDPVFTEARANKIYYGPVYFIDGSEPYMTLAIAADRPERGVIV